MNITILELKIYPHVKIHFIESKVDLVLKAPYKRKIFIEDVNKLA